MQRPGRALLWSVAAFGLATIIFGLSDNVYLSFAMLFLVGFSAHVWAMMIGPHLPGSGACSSADRLWPQRRHATTTSATLP